MPRNQTGLKRPLHRCHITGKRRFRTRKDAKLALRSSWFARSMAAVTEGVAVTTRAEVRYYECPSCGGFHLTSKPVRLPAPHRTALEGIATVASGSAVPC
jgi:hypothetical protein